MRLGNSAKPRFSASPGKRKKNKTKGSSRGGQEHPHAKTIQEAYSTVVLEASELGAAAAKNREEMLKSTAKLASDWTKTTINVDAVRDVVG